MIDVKWDVFTSSTTDNHTSSISSKAHHTESRSGKSIPGDQEEGLASTAPKPRVSTAKTVISEADYKSAGG